MLNDFTATNAADFDAGTDGQLMAILELRQDDSLAEERHSMEVVNRVPRLGVKAQLTPRRGVKAGLVSDDSDNEYPGCSRRLKSALESRVYKRKCYNYWLYLNICIPIFTSWMYLSCRSYRHQTSLSDYQSSISLLPRLPRWQHQVRDYNSYAAVTLKH